MYIYYIIAEYIYYIMRVHTERGVFFETSSLRGELTFRSFCLSGTFSLVHMHTFVGKWQWSWNSAQSCIHRGDSIKKT